MNGEKLFSEIFEEFENATTKEARIKVLKDNWHPRLKEFLTYAFDPQFQFDVEIPQYRPAEEPAGLNHTYLDLEVTKLYRFIKNHPQRQPGLTPDKQKQLLKVVLESLHKDEADLLVRCIKKNLGIKFLTIKFIQEAFK